MKRTGISRVKNWRHRSCEPIDDILLDHLAAALAYNGANKTHFGEAELQVVGQVLIGLAHVQARTQEELCARLSK